MSFQKYIKLCDLELLKDREGNVAKDENGNPRLMTATVNLMFCIEPNKNYDAKYHPAEYSLYVTCAYWNFVGLERCIKDNILESDGPITSKEEE